MVSGSVVPDLIFNLPLPLALIMSPDISSKITSISALLLAVRSRSTSKLKSDINIENIIRNFKQCDDLISLKFNGGYKENNENNKNLLSFQELINVIATKTLTGNTLIDIYNSMVINSLLFNLHKIICK